MTKTLTFLGQSAVPDGDVFVFDTDSDPPRAVHHGQKFEVEDDQFIELLSHPTYSQFMEEFHDLSKLTRAELETIAQNIGLQGADDQKKYATKADLADAVTEAMSAPPAGVAVQHIFVDSPDDAAEEPVQAEDQPAPAPQEGEET